MGDYKAKDNPAPIADIGIWLDLIEFCSGTGIGLSVYIIIFTSNKLQSIMPDLPDSYLIISAFIFQHILFGIKILLAEVIEDVPEWINDDEE